MRMIFSSGKPEILRQSARGLVVVGEHGDEQALLVEREIAGQQLPGEQDGALLEIVAEGEIAEHLEEGVVARGVADIVEVVVLAAGAHAFLRRGHPRRSRLLGAGQDVLERHHAGIGEHQRRIVARHERRRRHDDVIVPGEEIEKGRADVVGAARHGTAVMGDRRAALLALAACGLGARRLAARGLGARLSCTGCVWRRSWRLDGGPWLARGREGASARP